MKIPFALVLSVAILAICTMAVAGLASFSVRVQEDLRVADVKVVDVGGEPYVSLSSLAGQIGGACRMTPERIQVDLAAKAAWLNLDVMQVSSSLGVFDLSHPVHGQDGEALIALTDVAPFFQKAFNLAIRQDLPAGTAQASTAPPATPVQEEPTPATFEAEVTPQAPESLAQTSPARAVNRPIQTVILDPGHGGTDAGCEGPGGLKESHAVLSIALKTGKLLEGGLVKVLLTRETDKDMLHAERAGFANKNNGDLYIAIHLGGGLSQAGHGIEVFCRDTSQGGSATASPDGKPAERPGNDYAETSLADAKVLADSVATASGQDRRGVRQTPCAILGDLGMPGMILETGYASNPAEESLLLTEEQQDKIARGLAEGIEKLAAESKGAKP